MILIRTETGKIVTLTGRVEMIDHSYMWELYHVGEGADSSPTLHMDDKATVEWVLNAIWTQATLLSNRPHILIDIPYLLRGYKPQGEARGWHRTPHQRESPSGQRIKGEPMTSKRRLQPHTYATLALGFIRFVGLGKPPGLSKAHWGIFRDWIVTRQLKLGHIIPYGIPYKDRRQTP